MSESIDKKNNSAYLLLGFLIIGLAPWFFYTSSYSVRTDVAWHLISSSRFVDGGTMAQDFAETNPPLIILVYAVPAWIAKVTGLPLYYFPFYFMLTLNILSAFAVYGLLRFGKCVQRSLCVVASVLYFNGLTQLAGYETGQREHLIITGLMPFLLAQYCIDKKAPVPLWLLYGSLILGGILILLKPHYGILPSAVFVVRAFQQEIPAVLKSPDFIVLSVLTASYIGICFAFFSDYITQILPDVITLYLPYGNDLDVAMTTGLVFAGIITIFLGLLHFCKPCAAENKKLTFSILLAALVCIVPPVVQAKGFLYHFLPSIIMIAFALGIMINDFLAKELKSRALAGFMATGMFLFIGYTWYPPNPEYPTHDSYASLEIPALINEHAEGGHLYMFMDNIGISMPAALYTKAGLASRQPVNWFFIAFAQENAYAGTAHSKIEQEELETLQRKYVRIMVEDLQRYKPEIIAIAKPAEDWPEIFQSYYFFDLYGNDQAFITEWKNYTHFKEITAKKDEYHKGLMQDSITVFDIYKRKPAL